MTQTILTRSERPASSAVRLRTFVGLMATATSLFVGSASAQVHGSAAAAANSAVRSGASEELRPAGLSERPRLQPIRDSLPAIEVRAIPSQGSSRTSVQAPAPSRKRSVTRRVLGGAVGATAGLFAGGYLGAAIEGDRCHCDDPGLVGALIGVPVGAATGGILGALFLF